MKNKFKKVYIYLKTISLFNNSLYIILKIIFSIFIKINI